MVDRCCPRIVRVSPCALWQSYVQDSVHDPGERVAQRPTQSLQHGRAAQEDAYIGRLARQHFFQQVIHAVAVAAAEASAEVGVRIRIRALQREGGPLQAGDPALRRPTPNCIYVSAGWATPT